MIATDIGQRHPAPAVRLRVLDRLRAEAGGRVLAVSLALLIEALLLLLFLSMSFTKRPGETSDTLTVVDLAPSEAVEDSPEPVSPAAEEQSMSTPTPTPTPTPPVVDEPSPASPVEPARAAPPAVPLPTPPVPSPPLPVPPASTGQPASPARPAPSRGAVYGPPDTGRPSSSRDTPRVGTAPNGEPLYAAAWYREPSDEDLRGYLSTASGPGWGLIACRTVPDFRVEDCVGLDEYPQGSQINRAVLAAAWQFQVRPPRLGGVSQVGSWIRIRIEYGLKRR